MMIAVLVCMVANGLQADDPRERFEAREYKNAAGERLLYRLLKPHNYDPAKSYPLVVFWHGAGERGDDNARQLVHGMKDFASDERMAKHPAFVIAPQCPTDEKWANVSWSEAQHTIQAEPSDSMRLSIELIDTLQKEFSIDAQRLYACGLSMGGFGVWDALHRYPQRFAAGIPICGGGDPAGAKAIASVPVWAFHGGADPVVKPNRSREMVTALQEAGATPKYTEYPGVGHDSWTATFANPEVHQWLFSQRKEK